MAVSCFIMQESLLDPRLRQVLSLGAGAAQQPVTCPKKACGYPFKLSSFLWLLSTSLRLSAPMQLNLRHIRYQSSHIIVAQILICR